MSGASATGLSLISGALRYPGRRRHIVIRILFAQ
jgi:hypothetical protein